MYEPIPTASFSPAADGSPVTAQVRRQPSSSFAVWPSRTKALALFFVLLLAFVAYANAGGRGDGRTMPRAAASVIPFKRPQTTSIAEDTNPTTTTTADLAKPPTVSGGSALQSIASAGASAESSAGAGAQAPQRPMAPPAAPKIPPPLAAKRVMPEASMAKPAATTTIATTPSTTTTPQPTSQPTAPTPLSPFEDPANAHMVSLVGQWPPPLAADGGGYEYGEWVRSAHGGRPRPVLVDGDHAMDAPALAEWVPQTEPLRRIEDNATLFTMAQRKKNEAGTECVIRNAKRRNDFSEAQQRPSAADRHAFRYFTHFYGVLATPRFVHSRLFPLLNTSLLRAARVDIFIRKTALSAKYAEYITSYVRKHYPRPWAVRVVELYGPLNDAVAKPTNVRNAWMNIEILRFWRAEMAAEFGDAAYLRGEDEAVEAEGGEALFERFNKAAPKVFANASELAQERRRATADIGAATEAAAFDPSPSVIAERAAATVETIRTGAGSDGGGLVASEPAPAAFGPGGHMHLTPYYAFIDDDGYVFMDAIQSVLFEASGREALRRAAEIMKLRVADEIESRKQQQNNNTGDTSVSGGDDNASTTLPPARRKHVFVDPSLYPQPPAANADPAAFAAYYAIAAAALGVPTIAHSNHKQQIGFVMPTHGARGMAHGGAGIHFSRLTLAALSSPKMAYCKKRYEYTAAGDIISTFCFVDVKSRLRHAPHIWHARLSYMLRDRGPRSEVVNTPAAFVAAVHRYDTSETRYRLHAMERLRMARGELVTFDDLFYNMHCDGDLLLQQRVERCFPNDTALRAADEALFGGSILSNVPPKADRCEPAEEFEVLLSRGLAAANITAPWAYRVDDG